MRSNLSMSVKGLMAVACVGSGALAPSAHAAFHLWNINEIYTNSTGTLQFIELVDNSGNQNFVGGQQINVSNLPNTITNMFTLPGGNLPGSTQNHFLLFGTAGIQAAGGPAPDYIIPNGFLFAAGGSISFFGANGGAYTALPTDGFLSRTWNGGNALNTPTNYGGHSGTLPSPASVALIAGAGGTILLRRRRA